MEKFIFLDFDGVLNSSKWFCKKNRPKSDFDPKKIKLLNYIIEKTNAKIVLSTSWRFDKNIIELCKSIGIKGEVIGVTPSLKFVNAGKGIPNECFCRGNEIAAFLENYTNKYQMLLSHYDYPCYVILDDEEDMLMCQKDNFVKTNFSTGLTKKNADKAIKILNKEIDTTKPIYMI